MRRESNLVTTAVAAALTSTAAFAQSADSVSVLRANVQLASIGAPENFTGTVRVESRFKGTDPARVAGALVSFEPRARTAWHTHPLGQTLYVTSGSGFVQHWGGEIQDIRPGDVVWIPPGIKHWHGATTRAAMSHLAFSEALDGKSVDWLEHVTETQYPN